LKKPFRAGGLSISLDDDEDKSGNKLENHVSEIEAEEKPEVA
jgi:hypothetical protein